MAVHGFDQHAHALRWGELADAVTQVENLGGARGGLVGVRLTKRFQHASGFGRNRIRRGKQGIGVKVALQGFAWATYLAAYLDRKSVV